MYRVTGTACYGMVSSGVRGGQRRTTHPGRPMGAHSYDIFYAKQLL